MSLDLSPTQEAEIIERAESVGIDRELSSTHPVCAPADQAVCNRHA